MNPPRLRLDPPTPADADALLAFELANRAYFESHINARPAAYSGPEGVQAAIAQAQREAEADQGFQYLVRDDTGALVARVNLSRVRRAHFHAADLGYRVGQAHAGRGVASEAVRLVLAQAFGVHGLVRLEATARPENEGSVRVLTRNGFTVYGRSTRSLELGGAWWDLLHFERRAP